MNTFSTTYGNRFPFYSSQQSTDKFSIKTFIKVTASIEQISEIICHDSQYWDQIAKRENSWKVLNNCILFCPMRSRAGFDRPFLRARWLRAKRWLVTSFQEATLLYPSAALPSLKASPRLCSRFRLKVKRQQKRTKINIVAELRPW